MHLSSLGYSLRVIALGSTVFALAGCQKAASPDLYPEVARLTTELREAREKAQATDRNLAGLKAELISVQTALDAATLKLGDREKALADKDSQLKAAQVEVLSLKKKDALAYLEASSVAQRGLPGSALGRYQEFVAAYPMSPLVADANRAISELSVAQRTNAKAADPKKETRSVIEQFGSNVVSLDEILPLIKGRLAADLIKQLGPPTKTFRDGTELGYVDKVLDPATGQKETLVIVTKEGLVVGVRLGYRGKVIPLQ